MFENLQALENGTLEVSDYDKDLIYESESFSGSGQNNVAGGGFTSAVDYDQDLFDLIGSVISDTDGVINK